MRTGQRLREVRLAHGYSQAQVAALLNEEQDTTTWLQTSVSKLEAGQRIVTADVLRSYCAIFAYTFDAILGTDPQDDRTRAAAEQRLVALRLERNAHLFRIAEIDAELDERVTA
jgi:transcriptional regulator with XRE-family HTH domain